jgi:1-acyl-sn-glycerol-3-phosphate acyltransferase
MAERRKPTSKGPKKKKGDTGAASGLSSWPLISTMLKAFSRDLLGNPNIASLLMKPEVMNAITTGQHLFKKIKDASSEILSDDSELDEFGMDRTFIETLRPLFQFLYYNYFRVEAKGVKNVPLKKPAILVGNHAGTLPYDGTMVHLAVYNERPAKRGVRFLVDDFVFKIPLLSTFISRTGGVRASQENAKRLLEMGEHVLVFPEGVHGVGKTYDERYQLQQFGHGGFVRLAMRTGASIIPVAIVGSEEIHPLIWKSHSMAEPLGIPFIPFTPTFPWLGPLGLAPLPSKWSITFGKPISFKKYKPADADKKRLVNKLAGEIQSKVQKMLDEELDSRTSIWN